MNLFEYDVRIRNFEFEVDEETGEILNSDELDALEMERESKVESLALYVKELRAEADALKNEEGALAKRRKAASNKADSIASYLASVLNNEKFKTSKVAISYRTSRPLRCEDESVVPDEWFRVTTNRELDKASIKEAIADGVEVPGCSIDEVKNIQIK